MPSIIPALGRPQPFFHLFRGFRPGLIASNQDGVGTKTVFEELVQSELSLLTAQAIDGQVITARYSSELIIRCISVTSAEGLLGLVIGVCGYAILYLAGFAVGVGMFKTGGQMLGIVGRRTDRRRQDARPLLVNRCADLWSD